MSKYINEKIVLMNIDDIVKKLKVLKKLNQY